MPYIGNTAADRFVASKAASVYSGDGSTTAFTLEHSVGSDEDILVSVDGVIQEPSVAYAVSSGTTLTFTAAPSSNSGNNIFVYYLFRTVATVDHPATSALSATSGTFSTDLTVDTTTLVVDSTNNRVGIGTASPTQLLQVESSTNSAEVQLRLRGLTSGGGGRSAVVGFDPSSTTSSENHTFIGDGSSKFLKVDNVGHVTMPSQPCFSATASTTNIPLVTSLTIPLSSERFDVGNNLSSNIFTAPVTGKYLFTYMFFFTSLDADHTGLDTHILTSNAQYQQTFSPNTFFSSDGNFSVSGSILADMDSGDTCKFTTRVAGGSAQTDIHIDSQVSGVLIC